MALRKALAYSKRYARPYTRVSRVKARAYIKVVPQNKVVKYTGGNVKAFNAGKFGYTIYLKSMEKVQIRDNALESCRQFLTKFLDIELAGNYYLELRVHPHHILRNNKTAAGAGADRLSSGMARSFGVVEGRAALVKKDHDLFIVHAETEQQARRAREGMTMVKAKLPCAVKILQQQKTPAVAVKA